MKKNYPRQHKQIPGFLILLCCVFLFAACSTIAEKSGEVLDGSAFSEKELTAYRSGDSGSRIELRRMREQTTGAEFLSITSERFPGLELRTSVPRDGHSVSASEIEFTQARILSSHVYGWNELSLGLFGAARCVLRGHEASLEIDSPPERIQVDEGAIRLRSSRLTGAAALTSLRNRRERILALAEWMDGSEWGGREFFSGEAFAEYWKPILFPELVKKKEQPREYTTENAEWTRADSVRWNTTYTEWLFPEELRELRDSGTLLRDWEEAAVWIFYECHWDSIIASFNGAKLALR
ncbi:hypothetical protein [Breznakiella homolactica]|uniref:Uncharacterized protein n=1 Tax=Breznakiella homolactica TaxID=2798577 RepID=A0A7T7XJW9_9SPIR|nr:hypothetical protein [Breznakiella homolactica]QQO07726.1 hypothetical protein JFL75_12305 [Breznakiella homolactica]